MNRTLHGIVIAGALAAAAGGFAVDANAQAMDPDTERARQLIYRIRTSMREIDALLLNGADPAKVDTALTANQKRIEELLNEADSKSDAVMQQIDELIAMSKSEESSQQSPPSGEEGSPPPPKDGQGKQGKSPERPRSPDSDQLQPQPKPDQNPGGDKPEPQKGDADPKKGDADPSKGEQRDAKQGPPPGATGEFERTDLSGRWGMLPDKEAEALQRRSAEEFPQRYRTWMEQYFRRVSRLPSRD